MLGLGFGAVLGADQPPGWTCNSALLEVRNDGASTTVLLGDDSTQISKHASGNVGGFILNRDENFTVCEV